MSTKRIPTPTQDAGNWGTILNDHLAQTKNPTNGAFNSFDQFSLRPTTLTADDVGKTFLFRKTSKLHEWQGSTWKVNDESIINVLDYGVIPDGVTDNSARLQQLVNEFAVLFFPKGNYIVNGVLLPETKQIKLFGDGNIICKGDFGFKRTNQYISPSTEGILVKFEVFVEDLTFIASTPETKCIYLDHFFASGGNFGLNITKCTFELKNGAIGIALSGCGFNRIISNYFKMEDNNIPDIAPSFGIVTIAKTDLLGSCQTSVMAFNVFYLGISIIQRYLPDTVSAVEGWTSTGNFYFASKFNIIKANTWRAVNEDFVSSHVVIDSCNASQISNCYIDRNSGGSDYGVPLIEIRSNATNTQALQIINNQFNSQGGFGEFIVFTGASSPTTGNQITNTTISGNTYLGQQNINNNGIVFNAPYGGPTRTFIGNENFFNMTSCIKLITAMTKSVIAPFIARDSQWWLENASANNLSIEDMTTASNIDYVYQKISCFLTVPTYLASGNEEAVSSYTVNFGRMGKLNPIVSITNISSTEPETYPYFANVKSASFEFQAVKRIPAVGGRKFTVKADIIVDGTKYLYGGE